MRKIVSSIDIGSDSIKLIIGELVENRLNILSAEKVENHGIENGRIVNANEVSNSIKKAVENASNTLGIEVPKMVLGIDLVNAKLVKVATAIKNTNENLIITGDHVTEIIQKCPEGKVPDGNVLIGVLPVEFTVDGDKVVEDPKGIKSENLGLKAIIVTSPKDYVSERLDVMAKSGLKVIDVVPNCVGDYYAFKNKATDSEIGIIINLGNELTTVSVFNRGILTNSKVFEVGSKNIAKDIAFISKIDEPTAKAIYKDIVLASSRLANPNEYRLVTNKEGKELKLNQYDLSEIAASRIEEILNLTKKQINILTKKEISYIIVSGGLTELRDFPLILESTFGKNVTIGKISLIGARDNSYSSAIGMIKYFNSKLDLRGKNFSIFNGTDLENMNNGGKKTSVNNESLLGKVFGYFFDS